MPVPHLLFSFIRDAHYTLVVLGKLYHFFSVQKADHPQREFSFLPLVSNAKPVTALISFFFPFFFPFSGWLVRSDYCCKQPTELGRGLCLSGRPEIMRKKKDTFVDEWVFPYAAPKRAGVTEGNARQWDTLVIWRRI